MNQIDLFDKSPEFFLYGEIEKTRTTVDKLRKNFYAMRAEMLSEMLEMKDTIRKIRDES